MSAPTSVRCDCCGRRRNLMSMWPIDDPRDEYRALLVCEDRHGCRNLYMPIPAREVS